MSKLLERRLRRLLGSGHTRLLGGGHKGLEKESLRITAEGCIAQTPHPAAWGAPLTHPYITTDYSEALPEFITPAFTDLTETVGFLEDIHRFLYRHLPEEELLWASSMPCAVSDDGSIPIARYGTSNSGRMKHIYRVGLDYRYGRRMQAIAGVHFNYSLPLEFWPVYLDGEGTAADLQPFIDDNYFALIRNFKRLGWMVPFLFGNSPAVCKSFLAGRTTRFKELMRGTYYLPHATSLRMSDIGYKNKNQAVLTVSYDTLADYVASLQQALRTPYPEYEAIGLYDGDERIQLSTNLLQIENEHYSFVRPKRTVEAGERATNALRARGVEYVEVRALDVNTSSPIGVDLGQLQFVEAFLIFCLLEESPPLTSAELRSIEYNELTVALRGRAPGLELIGNGGKRPIRAWSLEICERMYAICEALDATESGTPYVAALKQQIDAIRHPDSLPSARILDALRTGQEQFHNFAMDLSTRYAADFRARPPAAEVEDRFTRLAIDSHAEQARIEAADDKSLEDYITHYITA
ncbi:MAG: glutamate--cysteine ligase [Gammaproteobacteria bacterium]